MAVIEIIRLVIMVALGILAYLVAGTAACYVAFRINDHREERKLERIARLKAKS